MRRERDGRRDLDHRLLLTARHADEVRGDRREAHPKLPEP
jgi:hypothetical protein